MSMEEERIASARGVLEEVEKRCKVRTSMFKVLSLHLTSMATLSLSLSLSLTQAVITIVDYAIEIEEEG